MPAQRSHASFFKIVANLFPGRERTLLVGVLSIGVIAAFFEMLAVASILPFMTFMVDPAAMGRYPVLQSFAATAGFSTYAATLQFLGIVTVLLVTLGNASAAASVLAQEGFSARTRTRISSNLFAGYLAQPYAFHIQRDTPSIVKVLINDTATVMASVVQPCLAVISRGLLAVSIATFLFMKDAVVTAVVITVVAAVYALIFSTLRKHQRLLGVEYSEKNLERQRIAQETLGGIKELQVLGREQNAVQRFTGTVSRGATAEARNRTLAQLPKYVMETAAFGGILIATILVHANASEAVPTIVPLLALYGFAGYRLLPALQQIYHSCIVIRFNIPTLRELHSDLMHVTANANDEAEFGELRLRNTLEFRDVTFTHASRGVPVLRNIDLTIWRKEIIGIVGPTGSGKTTLADLILGLHDATAGAILIDGTTVTRQNMRAWRKHVGYVPQHVFLANASVTQNIAFGLSASEIDQRTVRAAAKIAQAEEFILRLPRQFETIVGEQGVMLSGGQRQRLGIARALYVHPDLLVLDEATSALDGPTEDAVMDAIRAVSVDRTVVMIAHRMRTVAACDRIIMLDGGRIVAVGPYDDLLETSAEFRAFVSSAHPATEIKDVELPA